MSLKKKIGMSLATMGLVSALVGGATFAYFTDNATNTGNTFTAGTVFVSAGEIVQTSALDVNNLAPGDVYTGFFTVTNEGTLQLSYEVNPNPEGALFNDATVTIGEFDNVLDPGESVDVPFTITYDEDATAQGVQGTLSFTVDAIQTANR